MVEQPSSSWLPKQIHFLEVIARMKFTRVLVHLGVYGADILKPTHLYSNMATLSCAGTRATKEVKARFQRRIAKKHARDLAKGKRIKVFWKRSPDGKYQGCKDLASTAHYPTRFATKVFNCWMKTRKQ